MNQNSGRVNSERGANTVDIAQVEIGGTNDIIDVRLEGESVVEDDTQTLYLKRGGNGGAINGNGEIVDFI